MKHLRLMLTLALLWGVCACESPREEPEVKASITSFKLLKEHNDGVLMGDIEATVGEGSVSLCTPLIVDPANLVADFESDGVEVYVGDVLQTSGQSANDFSEPVTYRVVSTSGHSTEWVVTLSNTGIPTVIINTPRRASVPSKYEDWLAGTAVKIVLPDGTVDYEAEANIRGRGNSTWTFPKKPYALKLEEKASILGMPKHKRWGLLANWLDRTSLRNHVAFEISRQTGLEWTPRGEFVELFLNGKHLGCYYLCEQIKVDKNRVNVGKLTDADPSGGFLMELDVYFDEAYKFYSPLMNMPYMFKDPDEVTTAQYDFMYGYVSELESALSDPERLLARDYTKYLDVDSFIDWWFVHELTGNSEPCHPKSSYMHKDAGGLLKAGPVWDFDWETFVPYKASGFMLFQSWNGDAIYYGKLFADPKFVERVKERWALLKPGFESIVDFIDSEAERLAPSIKKNNVMWPIDVVVNQDETLSYEAAVERMRNAYKSKLRWMDQAIVAM